MGDIQQEDNLKRTYLDTKLEFRLKFHQSLFARI